MLKLAILADIHANLPALQAVVEDILSWVPDRVIVAGDIINRGPSPMECLQLIQAKVDSDGWIILRGNHEEYVLNHEQSDAPTSGPEFDVHLASFWTFGKIKTALSKIRKLPLVHSFPDPNGNEIRITHASMVGIRDGIYIDTSDESLRRKVGEPAALFCVGHTHIPLIRNIDGTLVVNVGSAGLPFDRNIYPSYAKLTWCSGLWDAKIVRIDYDMHQAERDFFTTGYLEDAGSLARLVLYELREARSYLYQWALNYQNHVLAGRISMDSSVDEFLRRYS